MMMASSSASPPPGETSPSVLESSIAGVLFGAVFLLIAALIFTVTLDRPASSDGKNDRPMPPLPLSYPPTRTVDASDTYFGVKVPDPYRWLEDGKSPEVQTWLASQNKLARRYLDALPGRSALAQRYGQLLHIDTISVPSRSGDRYFYMKRKAQQEKVGPLLAFRDGSQRAGARPA